MDPQPITLSGARIRLEPIGPRHAEDLYAAGKDEVIWRYLTTPPFASLEDAQQWVEMCVNRMAAGGRVQFAVVLPESGKAIGSTGYLDIDRAQPDAGSGHDLVRGGLPAHIRQHRVQVPAAEARLSTTWAPAGSASRPTSTTPVPAGPSSASAAFRKASSATTVLTGTGPTGIRCTTGLLRKNGPGFARTWSG